MDAEDPAFSVCRPETQESGRGLGPEEADVEALAQPSSPAGSEVTSHFVHPQAPMPVSAGNTDVPHNNAEPALWAPWVLPGCPGSSQAEREAGHGSRRGQEAAQEAAPGGSLSAVCLHHVKAAVSAVAQRRRHRVSATKRGLSAVGHHAALKRRAVLADASTQLASRTPC